MLPKHLKKKRKEVKKKFYPKTKVADTLILFCFISPFQVQKLQEIPKTR